MFYYVKFVTNIYCHIWIELSSWLIIESGDFVLVTKASFTLSSIPFIELNMYNVYTFLGESMGCREAQLYNESDRPLQPSCLCQVQFCIFQRKSLEGLSLFELFTIFFV